LCSLARGKKGCLRRRIREARVEQFGHARALVLVLHSRFFLTGVNELDEVLEKWGLTCLAVFGESGAVREDINISKHVPRLLECMLYPKDRFPSNFAAHV